MTTLDKTPASPTRGGAPARAWLSLAVLSASLLVVVMDMTILNIAIPAITQDLAPSSDQVLWIVDMYSLVLAGLLIPAGVLADRWGRKRMLLAGYTVFAAASLLIVFVDTAGGVIAIRALLGIGGAMIMPTTLSMIRSLFTDKRDRATALAVWAAVAGLGAAIGPLVGGVLLQHFSWHAAFLVNIPLMVIGIALGAWLLPESRAAAPARWDVPGVVMSISGMVLVMWAVKQFGKEASLLVGSGWFALIAGLAILALFVVRCRRIENPLLDVGLFGSRSFTAGIVAALGTMFALGSALFLLAQWMQQVQFDSPIMTGVKLLPLALAAAVVSLAAPALADRFGARVVVGGGMAVSGLGMIALFAVPGGLSYATVAVALALVGAGMGALAVASALVMSGSPDDRAGNAASMEETSYELGSVLGVALLGSIASVLYRHNLAGDAGVATLPDAVRSVADESLGSAIAVAGELQVPELVPAAGTAFTESLQVTSLIGGVIMVLAGLAVALLIPRGTTVSNIEH